MELTLQAHPTEHKQNGGNRGKQSTGHESSHSVADRDARKAMRRIGSQNAQGQNEERYGGRRSHGGVGLHLVQSTDAVRIADGCKGCNQKRRNDEPMSAGGKSGTARLQSEQRKSYEGEIERGTG